MHDFSCLKALHVLARQLVLESSKTNEEQFLRCSFGTSEKFLDIRSQAAILFKMWQIRDLSRISHTFSRMVNWQSLLNMNPNCQILFITVKDIRFLLLIFYTVLTQRKFEFGGNFLIVKSVTRSWTELCYWLWFKFALCGNCIKD